MGDRVALLQQALDSLSNRVQLLKASSLYETAPMYELDQPPFLNAVLLGDIQMGPRSLLDFCKQVETAIGRQTRQQYGPREVDIDVVAYGSLQLHSRGCNLRSLQVPHPLTSERRFVLEPLAEIAPEFVIPGLGKAIDILQATKDQAESVVKLSNATLSLHSN
jgi:2-amino-4-hydroxy-6-hydroxymethyldihydropteridine diphosphokinase